MKASSSRSVGALHDAVAVMVSVLPVVAVELVEEEAFSAAEREAVEHALAGQVAGDG